jgi:hypothetical protein
VLVLFDLYQQLENHIIVPRVYANTLKISPLVALVALLLGAKLLEILGMLISLPLVAALPGHFGLRRRAYKDRQWRAEAGAGCVQGPRIVISYQLTTGNRRFLGVM